MQLGLGSPTRDFLPMLRADPSGLAQELSTATAAVRNSLRPSRRTIIRSFSLHWT